MDELKKLIREVPDFPKPGINFYDITTLLKHPEGLRDTVDALASQFEGEKIDSVIGIEARGFIFAPDSCRCASRESCRPSVLHFRMISSMARTRYRSIAMLSATDIAYSSPMTCSPLAAPRVRLWTWSSSLVGKL